jgi:tRNA(Ile2) C34 agmatinyltransferase TiaS
MSEPYTTKCEICRGENLVEPYGDWTCSTCGQKYEYDEMHMIVLTEAQREILFNHWRVEKNWASLHEDVRRAWGVP